MKECHTWLYIPSTRTEQEIKGEAINYIREQLKLLSNPSFVSACLEDNTNHSNLKDVVRHTKCFYIKWLNRIQSNSPLWRAAIYSNKFHTKPLTYKNSICYERVEVFDVFTCYDCSAPDLHSYEETELFCRQRGIELDDVARILLILFFGSYGGLIVFE